MDFKFGGGRRAGLGHMQPPPPGIAEVRAYWEGLRVEGGIPGRSALDPRGLSGALDRVFLAERIGPGLAQIRLAGSVLSDVTGMDPRGLPLSCLFAPEARDELARVVARVFDGPVAAELHIEAARETGRPALDGRLALLPLRDAAGATTLLLGCFGLRGDTGRAPRRFDIMRSVEERLSHLTATFVQATGPVTAANARAHLRLVYSSD